MTAIKTVLEAFQGQIRACQQLGSPFTATLLEVLTAELTAGGVLSELVGDWPGDPAADALPLRLAGALHALVLNHQAPDLAACYPPRAASDDTSQLTAVLRTTLAQHRVAIEATLKHPPQTNETLRSAVLLGGFMTLAQETTSPLRLLEIGASAGLNTIWDQYRYRLGEIFAGPAQSPVLLATDWQGPLPPLQMPAIASRAACDRAPIDLTDPVQRLRLRSYIWADQRARLARLEAAIELALALGVRVEQADAGDWVERQLTTLPTDAITVLYHSIMWQYLPAATQQRINGLMEAAGQRVPLAWLRFEPATASGPFELRLTIWQNGAGRERLLASAHPHGAIVQWLAS